MWTPTWPTSLVCRHTSRSSCTTYCLRKPHSSRNSLTGSVCMVSGRRSPTSTRKPFRQTLDNRLGLRWRSLSRRRIKPLILGPQGLTNLALDHTASSGTFMKLVSRCVSHSTFTHHLILRSKLSGWRVGCRHGWTAWSSIKFSCFNISCIVDSPFRHLKYQVQKEA